MFRVLPSVRIFIHRVCNSGKSIRVYRQLPHSAFCAGMAASALFWTDGAPCPTGIFCAETSQTTYGDSLKSGDSVEGTISLPAELTSAVRAGRCVCFVGSTFSYPAGGSKWLDLVNDFADRVERADVKIERRDAKGKAQMQYQHELMIAAIDAKGRRFAAQQLNEALTRGMQPHGMEQRVERLLDTGFAGLITSNWDSLLEGLTCNSANGKQQILACYPRMQGSCRDFTDLLQGSAVTAYLPYLKIEGDATCSEKWWLKHEDADKINDTPEMKAFWNELFRTHTVLFLGPGIAESTEHGYYLESHLARRASSGTASLTPYYAKFRGPDEDESECERLRTVYRSKYGLELVFFDHSLRQERDGCLVRDGMDAVLEALSSAKK